VMPPSGNKKQQEPASGPSTLGKTRKQSGDQLVPGLKTSLESDESDSEDDEDEAPPLKKQKDALEGLFLHLVQPFYLLLSVVLNFSTRLDVVTRMRGDSYQLSVSGMLHMPTYLIHQYLNVMNNHSPMIDIGPTPCRSGLAVTCLTAV